MGTAKTLVRKSNSLVHARFSFSIWEMRLFLKMVTQVQPGDEDFRVYQISIKELAQTFGIRNRSVYREINALTDDMLKKIVRIPIEEGGVEKIFKTSLVGSFEYRVDGKGYIRCSFHPKLKPYLLQLKSKYLTYDVQNVLKISSVNSIRVYELLKAYEGVGRKTFDLAELKEIL